MSVSMFERRAVEFFTDDGQRVGFAVETRWDDPLRDRRFRDEADAEWWAFSVHPALADSPQFLGRFENEREAYRAIRDAEKEGDRRAAAIVRDAEQSRSPG